MAGLRIPEVAQHTLLLSEGHGGEGSPQVGIIRFS